MAQFATAAELGELLGRTFAAGAETAQANMALELASAAIQGWTRQTLEYVEDDIIVVGGTWDWGLPLPERPVVDVTAVTVDGTPLAAAPPGPNLTGWRIRDPGLWMPGGWRGPVATVAVTYSHGYQTIPEDLKAVTLQVAARMLSNPAGVRQESIGTYSVSYGGDISGGVFADADTQILRRYRRQTASVAIGR